MPTHYRNGAHLLGALAKSLDIHFPIVSMTLEVDCKDPPLVGVKFRATADQVERLTRLISANGAAESADES